MFLFLVGKSIRLKKKFQTYTKRSERQRCVGAYTRRIHRWRCRKRATSRHPLNRASCDSDTQRRLTSIKDGTRKRRKRRQIRKMDLKSLGIDGVLPFTRCVEFEVNGERLLCVLGEDFLTSWNLKRKKKLNEGYNLIVKQKHSLSNAKLKGPRCTAIDPFGRFSCQENAF